MNAFSAFQRSNRQRTHGRRLQEARVWTSAQRLLWGLGVVIGLVACQPEAPQLEVDHLALAKQLDAKARASGQALDPADPALEQIIQELQLVPDGSADKAEADQWLKELRKAQRSALWTTHEEGGGTYQPKADVSDRGSRPEHDPSKGSFVGGVWLPYNNVDVNAIQAKSRGGASTRTASAGAGSSPSASMNAASSSLSVTIYTASWCGVCKSAKSYMNSKGISYTEKDVEKDPSAKAEVKSKTGGATGVPVLDVNGEIMVGFDKGAFDRMVARKRAG